MNMERTGGGLTPEEYAKDIEKVKKYMSETGITWPQAAQESIERITKERFLIYAFPTTVLLGPDGKIVLNSSASIQDRREQLVKTLEALLSGKTATSSGK